MFACGVAAVSHAQQAPSVQRQISRWEPVRFADLPGFFDDDLADAWGALVSNCAKPPPAWLPLCPQVRRMAWASDDERRLWLMTELQPYSVVNLAGAANGQLTAYFEPILDGSRLPDAQHGTPLYAPPAGLGRRKPWFSRAEIDASEDVQRLLRPLLYLADPIDAQVLAVQGSGRVAVREADGSTRDVRVVFAGSNDLPFRSLGRWLMDERLSRDGSWDGVRNWLAANPERRQELLNINPRVVFFKEKPLSDNTADVSSGPLGAQGVALTAGRSVAVDRRSIPLGTALWLSTSSAGLKTDRLVLAQDVGSAITGAVRADYFVGSGQPAHDVAAKVKQGLKLWVLWPRGAAIAP